MRLPQEVAPTLGANICGVDRGQRAFDGKLRAQVAAAPDSPSRSMCCQMKISEVRARPGGGVLRRPLEDKFQDQVDDH